MLLLAATWSVFAYYFPNPINLHTKQYLIIASSHKANVVDIIVNHNLPKNMPLLIELVRIQGIFRAYTKGVRDEEEIVRNIISYISEDIEFKVNKQQH